MKISTFLALTLGITLVAAVTSVADAAPLLVGQPSPVDGFGPDDGTELFLPEEAVVGVEGIDFFGTLPSFESSFGFYRSSDPTTLITIFSADDQDFSGTGDNPQLAIIDFLNGLVIDADEVVLEGEPFDPGMGAIGFFLTIEDTATGDELTLFTEAERNTVIGGLDAFASFRSNTEPNVYLLGAELESEQLILRIDLLDGVSAIPEPGGMALFLVGAMVVGTRIRKASTAG